MLAGKPFRGWHPDGCNYIQAKLAGSEQQTAGPDYGTVGGQATVAGRPDVCCHKIFLFHQQTSCHKDIPKIFQRYVVGAHSTQGPVCSDNTDSNGFNLP